MGSFNEVCALSSLNIGCGDKVKVLFLTQNPYVVSDQRVAHRGCYHYDQWFVRTPPLSGKYDDYGRAAIDPSPLVDLIVEKFQHDVVVKPYGFNPYHTHPVALGEGIDHYFQAAWEGRLEVQDHYTRPKDASPENWPTWERIHALLKAAKMPLQIKTDKGYNAQEVCPGVVCVTFNEFGKNEPRLEKAQKLLEKTCDCQLVYNIPEQKYEPALIVMPKGAIKKPALLADKKALKEAVSTHPKRLPRYRSLPVLAVMIREDVWEAYSTMNIKPESWTKEPAITIKSMYERLKKSCKLQDGFLKFCEMMFRESMNTIPFQTMAVSHIVCALEKGEEFSMDDVLKPCAELAVVENVMAYRNQAWSIPSLGGQEGHWDVQTKLLKRLVKIADQENKRKDY